MKVTSPLLTRSLLARSICAGLVMALLTPPVAMAGVEEQDAASAPQSQASQTSSPSPDAGATSKPIESQPTQTSRDQLPDSPDAVQSQAAVHSQTNAQAQPSTAAPSKPQPPAQSRAQQPVGAAAAEVEGTTGDAAFKPAGAAIAPAKQKRARMLLINVGT